MTENLERQVSVQVANTQSGEYDVHLPLPYPFHITDARGTVGRQDFWKGEPARLIGFQETSREHVVKLLAADFWEDPESAVGMWPVFADADGQFWTHKFRVTGVTVHGVTNEGEVL